MQIYPVNAPKNDHNRFCGPAVISAVTRMTTGAASRLIRAINGNSCVMGTHTVEVLTALKRCGIHSSYLARTQPKMTIASWLRSTVKTRTSGRVFLLAAGHHWQLISGRRFVCGITKDVVSITDDKVKRRARVTEVWELSVPDRIVVPTYLLKNAKTQPTDEQRIRDLAKKLAKEHGIHVERHSDLGGDVYWVCLDEDRDGEDESDPYHGNHYCYGWFEVHERVKDYVRERR